VRVMEDSVKKVITFSLAVMLGICSQAFGQSPQLTPMSLTDTLIWLQNFSARHGQWKKDGAVLRTNTVSETKGCSVTVSKDFPTNTASTWPRTAQMSFDLGQLDPDFVRVKRPLENTGQIAVSFETADGKFTIKIVQVLGSGETQKLYAKEEQLVFDSEDSAATFANRFVQAIEMCHQAPNKSR
jgi:hypothetical protein